MAKNPKKDSKKAKQKTKPRAGIATLLPKGLKRGWLARRTRALSTGQKVAGGVALLAAGLAYVVKQKAAAAPKSNALAEPTPTRPQ